MDGVTGTVTAAGIAGPFSYLRGPVAFPDVDPTVSEVWARLSTPLDSQPTGTTLTPFVTTGSNVLVGVHSVTGSGTLQETMFVTFDGNAGQWHVITADGAEDVIRVPWIGGEITERREVRREIVALYDAACARLGVTARPHD